MMKASAFLLLLVALISVNTSYIIARDYTNFTYLEFLGLSKPYPTPEEIKTAYRKILRDYHPDKAKNFLDRKRFDKYSKQIITAYSSKQIDADAVLEQMKRDFLDLVWEYVKDPTSKAKASFNVDLYYLAKSIDSYSIKTPPPDDLKEAFNNLASISKGLADDFGNPIALSHNLPDRLKNAKNKLTHAIDEAKKLSLSGRSTRQEKLEEAVYEVFNFSYVDQDIRKNIVKAIIYLIEAYKTNNDKGKALKLVTEMQEIIDREWGNVFPIDQNLVNTLNQLKTQPEAKIPDQVLREVSTLQKNVRPELDPKKFPQMYLNIIKKLFLYKPASGTKILEVYSEWIKKLINLKRWPAANQIMKIVLEEEIPQLDVPLPDGFNKAKQTLEDQKKTIEQNLAPSPTPTPTPSPTPTKKPVLKLSKDTIDATNKNIQNIKDPRQSTSIELNSALAISFLNTYKPASYPLIISVYLATIEGYIKNNEKDKAREIVKTASKEADKMQEEINKNKWNISEFSARYRTLKALANQLAAPTPTPSPTPTPKPDIRELSEQLQQLKTQLQQLTSSLAALS